MSTKTQTIFQHRTVKNYRVTLAGQQSGDTLKVSISIWSPTENFKKSKGRKIAEGRLNKGVKSVELDLDGNNPSYMLNSYAKELAKKKWKISKESSEGL